VSVTSKNEKKKEAIFLACTQELNSLEIVKYLVEQGAQVNNREIMFGEYPLHPASYYGNLELVEYLISQKAEIKIPNIHQETPLHLAANAGKKDIYDFLLFKGANPTYKDEYGQTAPEILQEVLETKEKYKELIAELMQEEE